MHLHLLIPGLLWPNEYYKAALRDTPLPALATLLGRGRLHWDAPVALAAWLAAAFKLDPAPFAALRLGGEDVGEFKVGGASCPHPQPLSPEGRGERSEPQRGFRKQDGWLCADPVQLSFTQQSLMLADASTLDLSMTEALAVIDSLNREFPDLGQFHAEAPERWYLRLAQPAALTSHRLDKVVGRRVDRFLPGGPDGGLWRRHFNEIQVLLHNHPVNVAREAAGRPKLNSVWFWGEGTLPDAATPPFEAVIADDILVRGFARHAGVAPGSAPRGFSLPKAPHTLAVVSQLQHPALYGDLDAWCDALQGVDRDWLAPALAAVKAGKLATLTLTALGDRSRLEIRLTRRDLWKFWRSASQISALDIPDLAGEAVA